MKIALQISYDVFVVFFVSIDLHFRLRFSWLIGSRTFYVWRLSFNYCIINSYTTDIQNSEEIINCKYIQIVICISVRFELALKINEMLFEDEQHSMIEPN